MKIKKPLLLLIFDGWGFDEKKDEKNAIKAANTPNWDQLWANYPHTLVDASGRSVGLPANQMGNSEVGHLHMGVGREVPQDLVRINDEIQEGGFFNNEIFVSAIEEAKKNQSALHIMGLLSPGGVHSHESHLFALVKMASERGLNSIYVHAFLDGRDTPPRSALATIQEAEALFKKLGAGRIASMTGRYYAMDRDQRWDRVELAYDMLTSKEAPFSAENAESALNEAYKRGENDEFVKPTLIGEKIAIEDQDVVVFMNFRADRARQLSDAFTNDGFEGFSLKKKPNIAQYVTLTRYPGITNAKIAYPPLKIKNALGEFLSKKGIRQLRIAETEKYAHVTFFFNGGVETPYPNEERLLVPSPKVATYDLQPEMSADELTDQLVEQILSDQYDFIVCNYANPDMVGHTGDFEATVKAIEVVDLCLGRIIKVLNQVGGVALITADHGNAECMFNDETQQSHTAHTLNPVPLIYTAKDAEFVEEPKPILYDIAPTVLYLLDLELPEEMTGRSLLIKR